MKKNSHLLYSYTWYLIKVTFGEHDICDSESKPESRFVLRVIMRSYSYTTYNNDIALLRLNDRVPINHIIRPICLPDRRGNAPKMKSTDSSTQTNFRLKTV